jgi:Apea-like HEPN
MTELHNDELCKDVLSQEDLGSTQIEAASPASNTELSSFESEFSSFSGFTFLLNVESVPDPPVEIVSGHILRRATPEEIDRIKTILPGVAPRSRCYPGFHWECGLTLRESTRTYQALPQEEWRYYVIAFEGRDRMSDLGDVLILAEPELSLGFRVMKPFGPTIYPAHLFHTLEGYTHETDVGNWPFNRIELKHIQIWRELFKVFEKHDHSVINLKYVTLKLRELNDMSHKSPLRFLGYFAVLESLLTHAPKPTDPYDSITRQVKKKILLLNRRFEKPLDISRFGSVGHESLWGKMYSYRSAIAHGGSTDFNKGELQALLSPEDALKLLAETTRAVARHALVEPQLVADLREC